jgi:signal transduction histidine kinase
VKKDGGGKITLYVIDALTACALMFFTEGTYPIVIYMLVLTEFYIDAVRAKTSMALFCICLPVYVTSRGIKFFLLAHGQVALWQILTQSLGGVLALCVHFLIVNVALAFYRQFLKLDKTLKELDESNQKLEKAYARAAEVSALEERQRIAKEIHDTAGHSITTVIMQTEAAKLIIDNDKEAAKSKIIAANLQAKHALEELRDSVHLLSGMKGNVTLKMALEHIIHESMDGTGVKIRSQIEDVMVGDAKYRFLCNSLKEGISNGLRHGKATAFWFELKEEEGGLRFLLSDNGIGMNGSSLKEGFGLTTMQERARAFGGKVAFESEMEEGFEICIMLPLDKA